MRRTRFFHCLIFAGLWLPVAVPDAIGASKVENRCIAKASRAATKFAAVHLREMSACRAAAAAEFGGVCPTVQNATKISKARNKFVDAVEKDCQSACSISRSIQCVSDASCPARDNGAENCSAGSANQPFDMVNLGFPGPYCEQQLGHAIVDAGDIADCVLSLMESVGSVAVAGVFGNVASGVSKGGLRCLAAASKGVQKLTLAALKSATTCRNGIIKGKTQANPVTCVSDDPKLTSKFVKGAVKLAKLVASRCAPASLAELDLCGRGLGATTTVAEAQQCLQEFAKELAYSEIVPALRTYTDVSFIDAIYPPEAVCGDNLINQAPNGFLLLGEECDGFSDAACPGRCGAPGDLFECTCLDVPRMRFFATSEGSETDAGWTGVSHNQRTSEASGFLVELSGCDCDAFDGVTCIGTTNDSECDVLGTTKPVCSFDFQSGVRCDDHGVDDDDFDGQPFGEGEADEDEDCFVCDAFSNDSGEHCVSDADCQSRCFTASGVAQGACTAQIDCPADQVCRGRCDKRQQCLKTFNGAPLPVFNSAAPVCTLQTFRSDVTGTFDIVTGSHEISYRLFSQVHSALNPNRPCPVCGGFCVGGGENLNICSGRCTQTGLPCMSKEDCSFSESCGESTPDCPGGFCELSRVCGANPTTNPGLTGKACRVTSEHKFFGSVSTDCLPVPANNVTGRGLQIDYLPWTSSPVQLDAAIACTAQGFGLMDCPCPAGEGGEPTRPNKCTPACNAVGPQFGVGCSNGNSSGAGTSCAGGSNQGLICDEDADCPGSSCSTNPKHCLGDPGFERFTCSTNADCGLGACVDACPGGRCLPMCVPTAADPMDGECAAGPANYHCSSEKFMFKPCSKAAAEGSCSAICSGAATACAADSMCPAGEVCEGNCSLARECEAGADGMLGNSDDLADAGICVLDSTPCFLNPIIGEGGTTANGLGDPTNMSTVGLFCAKPVTSNPAVNNGAGFGGPTRVRVHGTNVGNFDVIP